MSNKQLQKNLNAAVKGLIEAGSRARKAIKGMLDAKSAEALAQHLDRLNRAAELGNESAGKLKTNAATLNVEVTEALAAKAARKEQPKVPKKVRKAEKRVAEASRTLTKANAGLAKAAAKTGHMPTGAAAWPFPSSPKPDAAKHATDKVKPAKQTKKASASKSPKPKKEDKKAVRRASAAVPGAALSSAIAGGSQ